MNHVNVEEVEDQPDAVIGKFLVKSFTTLILFDTGASHSYISRGFMDKYKLPTKVLRTPMLLYSKSRMFSDAIDHWKPCFPLRSDNFGVTRFGCDTRNGLAIDVWRKH